MDGGKIMMRSLTIAAGFMVMLSIPVSGTIIYVPGDYSTIQDGVNAGLDGDTVLVQPGTYSENINFNGHNVILGSLFLITGDTTYISETIIDGNHVDTVVKFWSEEAATITGFTIRNGYGEYGGGISCRYSDPLITHNIITRNLTSESGGGIFCWSGSNPIITNNIISNNSAPEGGGLWICYSHPALELNTIVHNNAINGGGIVFRNCDQYQSLRVANNIIALNSASSYGGAIFSSYSHFLANNNTVVENSSNSLGKGMYLFASSPSLVNTIFWGNGTAEIYVGEWSDPEVSYCDIQGDLWSGEGNINTEPLFRDPENGDFHLMALDCGDSLDSPCIDSGSPDEFDGMMDCYWGLGAILSDMGAYGGRDSVYVGVANQEYGVPARFILTQNYPNPFNAQTTIRYDLYKPFDISIEIYDNLGCALESLVQGHHQSGHYQVTWHADNYPSGVYFARLAAGNHIENITMVLLR